MESSPDSDSDSGQGWRLLFSAGREERGGWRKSISDTGGETAGGLGVLLWWWGATNVMKGKPWKGFSGQDRRI